jgi:hexosaminidase
MKYIFLVTFSMLFTFFFHGSGKNEIKSFTKVIPRPQKIIFRDCIFKLTARTSIRAGEDLIFKAEQLRDYLTPATGFLLPVNEKIADGNTIELKLSDELSSLGEEGYKLDVTKDKILINAYKEQGLLWGIQTLRQMLPPEILREAKVDNVEWTVPCVTINDKPRFEWRGLMIDYSRTFWNVGQTKKYIDALSYYKMNKLHMHLTDDQGWRLEIDKYPLLTEIASKFDTVYNEPPEREGYFTKEDIRELVGYANDRNVELVPEIEMPGHTSEVFSAYPELSCKGETLSIHPFFKGTNIHEEILCAGKEETFDFLENVLYEVSELFPSDYVHIGGDEAPKAIWKKCPLCQKRIEEEGLEDEDELQSWFVRRIEKYLNSRGKKLIGWDEITEGGLSETATVMFWRSRAEDALLTAINQGDDVIMTPTSHCYFDYTYEKIPTEKVYSFEPSSISHKLDINDAEHILGVQANFWSHIDRTVPAMDRQIFPRLLGFAQ